MDLNSNQDVANHVVLTGVDDPTGKRELKVSLRVAVLIQMLMIASGVGGTYAAVRAGIDSDRQHIEQLLDSNRTLNASIQDAQRNNIILSSRIDILTSTLDFLSKELNAMQERLWDDRRRPQQ
jgi:hypothetical protein